MTYVVLQKVPSLLLLLLPSHAGDLHRTGCYAIAAQSLTPGLTQGKCRYAHELCSAPGVYLTRKRAGSDAPRAVLRRYRKCASHRTLMGCLPPVLLSGLGLQPCTAGTTPAGAKASEGADVRPSEASQHYKNTIVPHDYMTLECRKDRSGDKHTPKSFLASLSVTGWQVLAGYNWKLRMKVWQSWAVISYTAALTCQARWTRLLPFSSICSSTSHA